MSHGKPDIANEFFTLKTLREVPNVSLRLAKAFPDPQNLRLGIHELLTNAIEHGNLSLGFEAKARLLRQGKWEEEIERRLALPCYRSRRVFVSLTRNDALSCLTIEDQGSGFSWRPKLSSFALGRRPNGRGLLIAHNCGFNRIFFNPCGNRVTCASMF